MSFEAEARQALQVLDELLASDEDMLGLLLSERRAGTSVDPERHGVVELLLEAYHRRLSAVAGDVAELRGKVQAATELGRVTIDLNRNNIIKSLTRRGNHCGGLREPLRHRADAVAERTSRRWARGA